MAGIKGCPPIRYSQEAKVALVSEIDRRYRAGEGALRVIAASLGTTETSYYNWLKSGIEPKPASIVPATPRIYSPEERERLLAEADRHRAQGMSLREACRTVGFSEKSYQKWKSDAAPPVTMRPVEITALVPVTTADVSPKTDQELLSLLAPGGYRVEGLSIESAAALLRALA